MKIMDKILYRNNQAEGALLGITLLTIGNWLWLWILHRVIYLDVMDSSKTFIADFILILTIGISLVTIISTGYSLALILRFYIDFWKENYKNIFTKSIWGGVSIAIILYTVFTDNLAGIMLGVAVSLWIIFPLSLLKKAKYYHIIPALLSIILGSSFICYVASGFFAYILPLYNYDTSYNDTIFYLSGIEWYWGFSLGALLIVVAYILFIKILSVVSNKKVGELLTLPIKILWGLLLLTYLISLGTALYESKQATIAESKLEQRFNRPLTVEELAKTYYGAEKPDKVFWEQVISELEELTENLNQDFYYDFMIKFPDKIQPKSLANWEKLWNENSTNIESVNNLFASPPPQPERQFIAGALADTPLPELNKYLSFCRIQLLQLDFAIKNSDRTEAKKCLNRIKIINKTASKEVFLIGSLVWIAQENLYLEQGIVKLIQANILTDEDLNKLEVELDELEQQVPLIHQKALYSEATFGLDACQMVAIGKGNEFIGFPLTPFRWVFPQIWWQFAKDYRYIANSYNNKDFVHIKAPQSSKFVCSAMILQVLERAGHRFYGLTAKIRIVQALITAEKIRRKTGEFPDKLENLPLDPFTNTPINYHKGEITYTFTYLKEDSETESVKIEDHETTQSGIELWSVGPNLVDETSVASSTDNSDDILIKLMRLPKSR